MIDADNDRRRSTGYNYRASTVNQRHSLDERASSSDSGKRKRNDGTPIQFFVRSLIGGEKLVIQAHSTDSVETIQYKIRSITGVPEDHQRLVYHGRQLPPRSEQSLEYFGIENDITMHLLGQMQSSTYHHQASQLINEIASFVHTILEGKFIFCHLELDRATSVLLKYTSMTPNGSVEEAYDHVQLFISSEAPTALVMLYTSSDIVKKYMADELICTFINSFCTSVGWNLYTLLASEFCRLLKMAVGIDDKLYRFCQSGLWVVFDSDGAVSHGTVIQFFVRFPRGKSLILRAPLTYTVKFIHDSITWITGIAAVEQRLIYQGKNLESGQTLEESGILHDTTIQLVIGRMLSTDHPQAWQQIDDLVSLVFDILKSTDPSTLLHGHHIIRMLKEFLEMTPMDSVEESSEYLQIFISSSAPAALVMLYTSPDNSKKYVADESIHRFIISLKNDLPEHIYCECARMVLNFCKLLRGTAGLEDPLYYFCRSCLRDIVEVIGIARYENVTTELLALNDAILFVREVVVVELSRELEVINMGLAESTGLSLSIVHDFIEHMCLVRELLQKSIKYSRIDEALCDGEYVESLHHILSELHLILYDLLDKIELGLKKLEDQLGLSNEGRPVVSWWFQYLVILKELNNISKLFNNSEVFWQKISQRKVSLCFLIVTFAKSFDDYLWAINHKEVTNFEVRRHFVMMMFEEVRCGNEESYEMLIDRSQLLDESFGYIADADPKLLRGDLFMEFKNEEAIGPGVLREWFFLVCREMFNPHKALFVSCPNDRRRFLPNSASKVDPSHLEYFSFSGRMIALALMHKIQIGIVLDRVFFLQLAGEEISLEDIRDADPSLYSSCKKILEMDPEMVDEDILSLTFICDVEELGSKITVELCPNGEDTVVTSKNRKEYVNLLIQHRFITSIAPQIAHFSQGFADITTLSVQTSLFRSLDLGDLDQMLDGSGSDISVKDWKSHTDYNGYEESDPQISWFWKILECMSVDQRKALFFFWTSIKCLPLEGFGGLDSRLSICRTSESCEHLPSARTCFYQICFPPYSTRAVMQKQLNIITQEHFGYSFGNQ